MTSRILITGAAGKTGRAIIRQLAARGQIIRGLVRRADQSAELVQMGVQETAVGDMDDPAVLERAAAGMDAIYLICPNMHPNEASLGAKIINIAAAAGVQRFVYHSVLHPQVQAMPHHWAKMRVEEKLFASGLSFTILQPAAYMQNILAYWGRIVDEGIYAVPYALDTRINMVDLHDVASAAAAVLSEAGHEGAVYELCGPEALSPSEIAALLSGKLERDVRGQVIPRAGWADSARASGMTPYALDTLLKMFTYYEQVGFIGNPQVLAWLIGRPPATFANFLERTIKQRC